MSESIQQTIRHLHSSLRGYIEATYHISSPALIRQRKDLLDRPEIIHQRPYVESTPRYKPGLRFAEMEGLPPAALKIFSALASADGGRRAILYDPSYTHQSDAIRHSLIDGKNLVIMTGTGSGKTESFLLPILGKLAAEAAADRKSFEQPAMRALVLYPMNALVNDQLGRLRSLFGDPRVVTTFKQWAGRPPRFARYTSRTPYAGIRTRDKDQRKLKAFDEFYVEIERQARAAPSDEQQRAAELLSQLQAKGKWPAKPDLATWFGAKRTDWQDRKTGEFRRAVMLPDDTELLTRHEVQSAPPDLLVTNYSMLEYMLMRPIERPIFDATRSWLAAHPHEKFLVVLDEAHLYRGAAGAEVGLLLRRLRDRLDIGPERFQVICATASFKDRHYAPEFGAQLSGVPASTFVAITGDLDLKPGEATGSHADAELLARIDLDRFYDADSEQSRTEFVLPLLEYRGAAPTGHLEQDLYHALADYPPLKLLVNSTMQRAQPVAELGAGVFPDSPQATADAAVTALLALGSMARIDPEGAGLLPCRIHNFFRGLPGLWVCMDPDCPEVPPADRSGVCGKMYAQPRERCECGARVLELYTCEYCGTPHGRAYSDDIDSPSALWSQPGHWLRLEATETSPLLPLDLLLDEPRKPGVAEPAEYDLETGRLNPNESGPRTRRVYIRRDRVTPPADDEGNIDSSLESRGQFIPCAVCGKTRSGSSYVKDHQTKGDQPFQALVATQIQIQPPSATKATRFAPLRGRKVLVFSDSRQVAARLAPNLQMYSVRDSLRPLIAWGYTRLQGNAILGPLVTLEDLYLAVLLASKTLGVRLRPELKGNESFAAEDIVELAVTDGSADTDAGLHMLWTRVLRAPEPPESLLADILSTIQHPFLGLEALALASIIESEEQTAKLAKLPDIPGLIESDEAKVALARAWLRCWRNNGFWLKAMPTTWWQRSRREGVSIKGKKGKGHFDAMNTILVDKGARKVFADKWTPELLRLFTDDLGGIWRLSGGKLSLAFEGAWIRCASCKSIHRPVPGIPHCLDCGSSEVVPLDPLHDEVFLARRGYYRNPVIAALGDPPRQPMALIAAEHTAQLNAPQNEDVFSKAEENELLFQDVAMLWGRSANRATAIDVLSSTTTMEVGIDIGALSGVALRNMPPGRANYQQRSGRAGRRGNAVATVVAFGSADSHDEHYFSQPAGMIAGDVTDPRLTLDNRDITRRHIRAFLLQRYHQDRIPEIDPEQRHDLFSVLGTVAAFRSGKSVLNRSDFETWLNENEAFLRERIAAWIPVELSAAIRAQLLDDFRDDCLTHIDLAIGPAPAAEKAVTDAATAGDDNEEEEAPPEEGEEHPGLLAGSRNLLDRLLYSGVLPRYAFPTDVAAFHVFDLAKSSRFRPVMKFAPSQGLPIALTQYAPGKQIWISGKCYSSGAIYSVMASDRYDAWQNRQLYLECVECGFAKTEEPGSVANGDIQDCPACGSSDTFGPARYWMRPPGFAHPRDADEVTSPDDMPETSYATRAKLTMQTPSATGDWIHVNDRLRVLKERQHLLVSNTGPKRDGYSYCTKCGRIEATAEATPTLFSAHPKPFVDEKEPTCPGNGTVRHIVLGTDFITDIALFSLRVERPLSLKPGHFPTDVALRTVSEALAKAGSRMLDIEPGELMAEYRPAVTPEGREGLQAEIFLYDTLPGGAGFCAQLIERGDELFRNALSLMKTCPEGCDASCYRCLRSFRNKFEHALLDRHVGVELLEYLLTGKLADFDADRINRSTAILLGDLLRQGDSDIRYDAAAKIMCSPGNEVTAPILATRSDGKQFIIALAGPLTGDFPADLALAPLAANGAGLGLVVPNELVVRGNLPAATRYVQQRLAE